MRRLQMLESQVLDGHTEYRAGQLYLVEEETAEAWLRSDVAVDPEDLPACERCGERCLGQRALEDHVRRAHPPAPLAALEGPPPPRKVNANSPRGRELQRLRLEDVIAVARAHGIADADLETEGAARKIDWIRAILRAEGE